MNSHSIWRSLVISEGSTNTANQLRKSPPLINPVLLLHHHRITVLTSVWYVLIMTAKLLAQA